MSNLKIVNTPARRHDAIAKSRGKQSYSDDFSMPGMIYGKVLRSPHAAATILSINTEKAKALPGVHAVLTAEDVPNNIDISKFGQMKDVGGGFEGVYKVLATGKVRFKGEAIALIAADTEELCEEAMELVDVEYRVEKGVYDPREALKDEYLVSSEDDTNLIMTTKVEEGDVDAAWAKCDVIVENEYYTPVADHMYLELESGVAWMDENDVVTYRAGTQVLEHYRTIARVMGLPQNKVRNMGVAMGGGFGGKEDITVETYICLLAYYTHKPVKMVWTREESIEVHSKRHPEFMRYKTGATKDGRIIAQEAEIVLDAGGYIMLTGWVQIYSTIGAMGCYNIPNHRTISRSAMTNKVPNSANRGFGVPQVNFAYECQMDELAEKLGMSPDEVRRINVLKNGDPISTGFIPEGHLALKELNDKVWAKLNETPKKDRTPDGRKIGRGMALGIMGYGRLCFMHDSSRVGVRVELDGSVTLRAGVPDLGGGQGSVLCQIAAEELGLPMESVHVYIMDTHLTPLCGTTTATRQLYMSGNACLKAVHNVKKNLADKAAEVLDCDPSELEFINERIMVINAPERSVPFVQIVAMVSNDGVDLFNEAQFNAPFTDVPDLTNIKGRIHPDYTCTAHGVEVAVDEETGRFEILRIIAAADAGKMINVNSYEGQLEGGTIYNAGLVTENLVMDDQGIMRAGNLSTFLIPTSVDVPDVELIVLESGGGLGPYGAKGIGEPADNSIAPATLNAIKDAIGCRIKELPVTPEMVLTAIKEHNKK